MHGREVSFTAEARIATEAEGGQAQSYARVQVIPRVDESSFDSRVFERSHVQPVVVEFSAPWCAPCRALAPLLEAGARARADQLELVEVDVDESPALARRFWIFALPAVRAFSNGRVVARLTGARDRKRVERFFDEVAERSR